MVLRQLLLCACFASTALATPPLLIDVSAEIGVSLDSRSYEIPLLLSLDASAAGGVWLLDRWLGVGGRIDVTERDYYRAWILGPTVQAFVIEDRLWIGASGGLGFLDAESEGAGFCSNAGYLWVQDAWGPSVAGRVGVTLGRGITLALTTRHQYYELPDAKPSDRDFAIHEVTLAIGYQRR